MPATETATSTVPEVRKIEAIGEVEIEWGDNRNRCFAWGPTMEILRGAWLRHNLQGDEVVEDLAGIPDIPGMRIRLDTARGLAVIYDPLSLPENKEACELLQRIIKKKFNIDQGPAKTTERKRMDADDVKTWLYGMARAVDGKRAKVVKGSIPFAEDVLNFKGKTRIEMFNNSARACKWREDYDRYVDMLLSIRSAPPVV